MSKTAEVHKMTVFHPVDGKREFQWNGIPNDPARAEALAFFKESMSTGMFLAYAVVGTDPATRKATHIREFDETAEQITLTPRLAGGS
jgi:hypothetical protein